jgi:hypothetical protein
MADIKSKLILDNSQFNKATQQSKNQMSDVGKSFNLTKVMGTAAVGALVVGFGKLISK